MTGSPSRGSWPPGSSRSFGNSNAISGSGGNGERRVAIYHRGVKVVDLWGGYRCADTLEPWAEGTLALVFSASKGMAAAAMTVAHARGLFDLDERVATYWPEFAAAGKREITVRQLLSHQAGLVGLDCRLDADIIAEHDRMADILARQPTAWPPGDVHGYHTLTLGWYQNELIRRVDPRGRSLGAYFRDEICAAAGCRVPHRVAIERPR